MPSHPPSLLRRVERCLEDECHVGEGAGLVLGVSGGPDSMALLHVLSKLRAAHRFDLCALTIDHGLRSEASSEVELVSQFCEKHDVRLVVRRLGLTDGGNLQARARDARYQCLEAVGAEQFGPEALLVTAHHKEDRAETVLLRILRGTSLEGLAVLPPRDGRRVRPMVRASKADVLLHLERHGIPFAEDPSNRQSRFLRVRVRTEVLPLLETLGPKVIDHLVTLADEAGELDEPLGLNREQRRQLRQALRERAMTLDLPLGGGLRVVRQESTSPREPVRNSRKDSGTEDREDV